MYICDRCKCTDVRRYDKVKRLTKGKGGEKIWIEVERYQCKRCKHTFRVLPDNIKKFKQYQNEIIDGVKEGLIDSDTLGYENYPCEMTMKRWTKDK